MQTAFGNKLSCKSVLKYPGGKTVGIEILSKYMPNKGVIFTPFLGGASVELFMAYTQYPNVKIVANDLSKELYNFWTCIKKDRMKVINAGRKLLGNADWDRPKYYAVREIVYDESKATDPFQAAAAYFLCSNASFNGGIAKLYSEPSAKLARLRAKLDCVEASTFLDVALRSFKIYNLEYDAFLSKVVQPSIAKLKAKNIDYVLYLDPPYFVPQNHYGQGRQDRKAVFDHEKFAQTVLNASFTSNKWLVCYNDCPLVRKIFPRSACRVKKIVYQKGMHPEVIITPKEVN